MGQIVSLKGSASPHPLLRPLTVLTRQDLQKIYDKYILSLGQPFALNLTQVKVLFGEEGVATRSVFEEVFDSDRNGLVDACELFAAVAMLSKASSAEKIDFVHQLYDFSGVGELSKDEVVIMFRTVATGCSKMDPSMPTVELFQCEELAQQMFESAELESWQDLPKSTFDSFCESSPVVNALSEYWRQASSQVRLQKGTKWIDSEGPSLQLPADNPLDFDKLMPPEGSYVKWCRATELLQQGICAQEPKLFTHAPHSLNHCARLATGPGALGNGTILEGNLAARWLLNALAIAATRPGIVENLFCHTGQEALGRFSVQLWDGRAWEKIFVDDQIPCDPGHRLAFSKSSHSCEFWIPLVEKAFAKHVGSYAALLPGCVERLEALEDSVVTALRLISGGHVEKIPMFDAGEAMQCSKYLTDALKWGIVGTLRRVRPGQLVRQDGIRTGFAYGIVAVTEVPETGKILVKLRDAFGQRPGAGTAISDKNDLHAAQMADLQLEQDLELLDPQLRRELAMQRHFSERHFWMELDAFMNSFDIIYAANCPSMLQHCRDRTTTSMKKLAGGRIARRPLPFVNIVKQAEAVPYTSMVKLQTFHALSAVLLEVRQSPAMDPIWISLTQNDGTVTKRFDRSATLKGFVVVAHDWDTVSDPRRITEVKSSDVVFATYTLQRAFTVTRRLALRSGKYMIYTLGDDNIDEESSIMSLALAGIGDSISCYAGNEVRWQPVGVDIPDEDLSYAFGELQCESLTESEEPQRMMRTQECHQHAETFMSHMLSNRIHELKQEADRLHIDIAMAKGVLQLRST